MAHAIALVAVIIGLLATPSLAAEDVYVWRDASGAVRFTPVEQPLAESSAPVASVSVDRASTAQIAVSDRH